MSFGLLGPHAFTVELQDRRVMDQPINGRHRRHRAVKGHEYGLDLSEDERKALIPFLRTLWP